MHKNLERKASKNGCKLQVEGKSQMVWVSDRLNLVQHFVFSPNLQRAIRKVFEIHLLTMKGCSHMHTKIRESIFHKNSNKIIFWRKWQTAFLNLYMSFSNNKKIVLVNIIIKYTLFKCYTYFSWKYLFYFIIY